MQRNVLMTLAEDPKNSGSDRFAVKYGVDEEDCFRFAHALEEWGDNTFFVNWDDYSRGEFSRMFHFNSSRFVEPVGINSMDLIFSYKQEGFLFEENWERYEAMLARFQESPAIVVNDPATIRWNRSKDYLFGLADAGVSVIPTFEIGGDIRNRIGLGEKFIIKPKVGERGLDQTLVDHAGGLLSLNGEDALYLAQEFCPEVRNGERSLVFIGMEYSHGVIKRPDPESPNEYRCNESRGGTVAAYDPMPAELEFATDLLDHISQEHPVHFSRIDFVEVDGLPVLMEAELLNPSIYANYTGVGKEFGRKLGRYFDGLMVDAPVAVAV